MKQLEKNQRTTETTSNRKNVIDNYFKIGGLTVNDEQNRKSEMDQVYGNKTKKQTRQNSNENKKLPVFQKIVPNLNLNKIEQPQKKFIKFQQYQS